jgi:hypothetical protein
VQSGIITPFTESAAMLSVQHWNESAARLACVGPPPRSGPEDEEAVRGLIETTLVARVLVLGVTPELRRAAGDLCEVTGGRSKSGLDRHVVVGEVTSWLFLGTREVDRRTISRAAVVKVDGQLINLEGSVPQQRRDLRRQLGIDYGKIDYAIVDGELVVYDVNKTPGADARGHQATVAALGPGIREFLLA